MTVSYTHLDKIGYGTIATDISRESSDYTTFEATIPFKQLVMNGFIDYTTENVNLSSRNSAYFILQAAELGSIPKFILTYKNVDKLKETDFSYLYSSEFVLWQDEIRAVYEECASIREPVSYTHLMEVVMYMMDILTITIPMQEKAPQCSIWKERLQRIIWKGFLCPVSQMFVQAKMGVSL